MAIRIKLLTQLFESGICQIFKRYILNNSFSKKKLAALRKCMLKIYLLYRLLSYYSISKSNCKMGHQTPPTPSNQGCTKTGNHGNLVPGRPDFFTGSFEAL